VLLLDSDLLGLTSEHLSALIAPVCLGRTDVAISLRANAPHLWRLIGLDYISGERVMPLSLLQADLQALRDLPRFGIEVHLNRRWISAGQRIAVVPWPGVHSPSKSRKRGFFAGLLADLAMLRDISRTVSLRDAAAQIIAMRRLGI